MVTLDRSFLCQKLGSDFVQNDLEIGIEIYDWIGYNTQARENLGGEVEMKSTGIVRKVDELGRIVLPIELRRTLDIAEKDALEIYVDGNSVVLRKYQPACVFCGDARDIKPFHGKNICANCLRELAQ